MSHSHVAPPGFRTPNPLPGRSKRRPARAIDAARRRREAAADRDVAYGTAQFAGATLGSDAAERAMAIGKVEIPPKRMADYRYGSWLMTKVPRGSDPNVFYSAYRGAYLMTAETDATYGNDVENARRANPVDRSRRDETRAICAGCGSTPCRPGTGFCEDCIGDILEEDRARDMRPREMTEWAGDDVENARRANPVEDDGASEIFEDKRGGNRYMAVKHKADRWSSNATWLVMRVDAHGKIHEVRKYKERWEAVLCAKEMGKGRTESDAHAVVLAHRAKRATGRGLASAKKRLSSAYDKAKKHLESRRKANPVAAEDKFYANPYGGAPGFYFSSQEEYDRKSKELYKKTGAEEWSIEFIDGPTIDAKLFGAIEDLIGQDMTVWFDEIQDKDEQFKIALHWLITSHGERDIEKAISDAENEVIIREGDVEDWARELVDSMGGPAELDEQTLQSHFDFGSFGFALRANGELPEDEYEDLDDAEAAEAYVRDYYGDNLKELPKDVLTDHFDFRDFGEDAELGGEIHELTIDGQDYVIEYTG